MILTKGELERVLNHEFNMYIGSKKRLLKLMFTQDNDYIVWRYLVALRKNGYHKNNKHLFRRMIWERKKNKYGLKYGLYIGSADIGEGLRVWHVGDIVIHRNGVIGSNCQLHGMNCTGNKGVAGSGVPILGDNVNVGIGAVIIGDIYIADNVTIAANAVVNESCFEKGVILAGIPAKIIRKG